MMQISVQSLPKGLNIEHQVKANPLAAKIPIDPIP
jgi:hypothetical protein